MTETSLYERLGATAGIEKLVKTIVGFHLDNPLIAKRYQPLVDDPERMAAATRHLCDFLASGSGGPTQYTGRSMPDVHRGMNISGEEYLAAMDDIMRALDTHGIDERTRKDVLFIAYSLKPEIARL